MKENQIPLLEYDPSLPAIIEPEKVVQPKDVPKHCVITFFNEVLESLNAADKLMILAHHNWADMDRPLYELDFQGERVAAIHPGVGASLSCGIFEEIIARGCRKFIVCGGCGVLDREITVGHLIVPNEAVRDEGTSFHYLPPSREIKANPTAVQAITETLNNHKIPYLLGKTWTTDAPYRETQKKVNQRRTEGCITVEMEASAFFAVSHFRGVVLGQILYGGDDVSGTKEWDARGWHTQYKVRENLFWLAVEAVLKL